MYCGYRQSLDVFSRRKDREEEKKERDMEEGERKHRKLVH